MKRLLLGAATLAFLGACAVGPDYRRPSVETTAAFKELGDWQPSEPADILQHEPWWQIFKDPVLDGLEHQVEVSNQNIKAAEAAYAQAIALVSQSHAAFWPSVSATAGRSRSQLGTASPHNADTLGATANWELDIWGQLRRTAEADTASAQSSAANLAAAQLSARAALATAYFELRAQDELRRILDDTVKAEEQSLKITENRYRAGVAAKADVVTAQTQLLGSQAQQLNAGVLRAQLEHSIAVLIGKAPGEFALDPAPLRMDVPTVPVGLPSTLLERRPDIAVAERKMAAANAQIGVAKAAYFPSLSLSGSADYTGSTFGNAVKAANRVWSLGPQLALSVFDGGLRRAQTAQAVAAYDASVATYRQTVLSAFQQVEDDLVSLTTLERQAMVETDLVKAAQLAEQLTLNQYKAGTVPYSSVISAQTTAFASEQAALTVLLDRLTASVALIAAAGGGWTAAP